MSEKKNYNKYYSFPCIDCGAEHRTQRVRGKPRCPRCLVCAARIRALGRVFPAETRAKISASLMGHRSYSVCGKHHWTVEEKQRIGAIHRGKISPMRGKQFSSEVRQKMSLAAKGRVMSEETKQKMSQNMKKRWSNPAYAGRIIKSLHLRPTLPERRVEQVLNEICPNEYKYVGDGEVILGGFIPDFININGKKQVIEVFGDYWHSTKVTKRSIKDEEQFKLDRYRSYGFDCLILWEREIIKDSASIVKKIKQFNRGV